MQKNIKRVLLLIMMLTFIIFYSLPAMAASKGCMIKEYQIKQYYKTNGSWKSGEDAGTKYHKYRISYNKEGDPVTITDRAVLTSGKTSSNGTTSFKYTYKKGKTVKRTSGGHVVKYKKGVPSKETWKGEEGNKNSVRFKYKNRYATSVKTYKEASSSEDNDTNQTLTFKVSAKNGLPVKITGKEGNDISPPGIITYTITFYTSGAKKGLVKEAVRELTIDYHMNEDTWVYRDAYKFSYKVKKGLVTKATQTGSLTTTANGKENNREDVKNVFTFKYNNTKVSKKRYCSMINDIVANELGADSYGRLLLYTSWY